MQMNPKDSHVRVKSLSEFIFNDLNITLNTRRLQKIEGSI